MTSIKNISGQTFERLTVIRFVGSSKYGPVWLCQCNCGSTINVCGKSLKSGNTRSCGCLQKETVTRTSTKHGLHGSRVYQIWADMRRRCQTPSCGSYEEYGRRGIKVCQRWERFVLFLEDMGHPPTDKHELDRVDNNGHYEPDNCRWATEKTQARNRRSNRILDFQGESMAVVQWSEKLGISQSVINSRLRNGWSVERTLSTPKRNI